MRQTIGKILITLLMAIIPVTAMSSNFYGFKALTGGGTGALDKISGMANGDLAIGVVSGYLYEYEYNSLSNATANTPLVIQPVIGGGRWLIAYPYTDPAYVAPVALSLYAPYIDFNATSGGSMILNKPDMAAYQPLLTNPLVAGTMGTTGKACTKASASNTVDCNTDLSGMVTASGGSQYYIPVFTGGLTVGKVASIGSAGYVLTSNGPGAYPTWQASSGNGGNVSMTYPDAGIALSTGGAWGTSIDPASIVYNTLTVNGYPLSANVVLGANDVGLGNVTNDAQVKKIASSTNDNFVSWNGINGDTPKDSGYSAASFAAAFTSEAKNLFWGTPNATSGVPSMRAITAADLPANITANTSGTSSNLSGTPALPNGVTATTQSVGNNSTKLATTAYVDGTIQSGLAPLSGVQTLTGTGFSSSPTCVVYVRRTNNVVSMGFSACNATSNATTFTMTGLDAAYRPTVAQYVPIHVWDNGADALGFVEVGTTGTLTFGKVWRTFGGFTSSGIKGMMYQQTITYSRD